MAIIGADGINYLYRVEKRLDRSAKQWLNATLFTVNPYIPYLKCRLREAVKSSLGEIRMLLRES